MFTKVCADPWTGHFVVTATSDKKIKVFDTQSGESFSFLTGHSEPITGLAFSNDCRHLVSSSADGCLFVWEMSRDLVKVIFQRRVDQNGVESIELDSILAVEHFLNKASQQGFSIHSFVKITKQINLNQQQTTTHLAELPSWAKSKLAATTPFSIASEEFVEDKQEAPVAKGRWAQRLDHADAKENLTKKENAAQKRRYTIEPEEAAALASSSSTPSAKRLRTDAFSDHPESQSFETFLARENVETQKPLAQLDSEMLDYVEGEKSELHAKPIIPQSTTAEVAF